MPNIWNVMDIENIANLGVANKKLNIVHLALCRTRISNNLQGHGKTVTASVLYYPTKAIKKGNPLNTKVGAQNLTLVVAGKRENVPLQSGKPENVGSSLMLSAPEHCAE